VKKAILSKILRRTSYLKRLLACTISKSTPVKLLIEKLKGGGMARMKEKGEHAVQKQSKRGADGLRLAAVLYVQLMAWHNVVKLANPRSKCVVAAT